MEDKYKYSNITSNATTTLQSGAGVLHTINILIAGASSNTAQIYDNTAASGTLIGTLNTTALGSYRFDAGFNSGLTIVTGTGTAPNMTVTYI